VAQVDLKLRERERREGGRDRERGREGGREGGRDRERENTYMWDQNHTTI
jgi:hypothetical protein